MTAEKRKLIKTILLLGGLFFLLHEMINHYMAPKTSEPPRLRVVVQKPTLVQLTDYVTQTGTMVAYNSVDLVARIEGYLETVNFTDGTFVKKGAPLFVIEPKPYLEKLKAANATVMAQKASYAYATAEYARQKRMYQQNATSLNNVEKWAAQVEEVRAGIDKATADAEIAAINYSYTHVLAPFDGRIGRHLVDPGNLVGNAKATDLATIQQIDPIYVYFNLNELDLLKIRKAVHARGDKLKDIRQIPISLSLQDDPNVSFKGKLDFVNTGLNASTGTMEFRALLSNKKHVLLPGLFVRVRIPISAPTSQLTIPDPAIQYDQIGAYVLAVDNHDVVVVKRVTLGAFERGMRAITLGLLPTDNVIVSGLQNATPGHQVTLIQNGTTKP